MLLTLKNNASEIVSAETGQPEEFYLVLVSTSEGWLSKAC